MKVLIKSKLFRVCGYTTPESMRDPNRENSMRKKVAFMVVLNLAIVSYCVGLYFQGHSMQRVLVIFLLSATLLNVVAQISWKSELKRKNRRDVA
jgi:hypothetical protein